VPVLMMTVMTLKLMQIVVTETVSNTTDIWKLVFTSLQQDDFGTYMCEASNDLDTAVGEVILSR